MKTAVWQVCVAEVLQVEAEDVADQLRDTLGMEPVLIEKPASDRAWLELYYETAAAAEAAAQRLVGRPGILAVATRRCDARDWQSFWQRHFKPQRIGQRLLICPEWQPVYEPDRINLWIVPGLSFGTGEHFTTRFCLEMIEALSGRQSFQTLWDVGCGSGILAVAAALLGVPRVLGTDNDPICLQQAAENAALNGVTPQTEWRVADITDRSADPHELVCANLFASLLMISAEKLWAATGRYLILSGIREFELDAVAETFLRIGARECVRDGDGEWAGLLFERV